MLVMASPTLNTRNPECIFDHHVLSVLEKKEQGSLVRVRGGRRGPGGEESWSREKVVKQFTHRV